MQNTPNFIVIHHSADNSPGLQWEKVELWHRERGFPRSSLGWYIGYHWLIEKDGTARRARMDWEEGAHTREQNTNSIGICLAGNFNDELPTEDQMHMLGLLLLHYTRKYNITSERIVPHRHFGQTSCYGTKLPDKWAALVYEGTRYRLGITVWHDFIDRFKSLLGL